MTITLHIQLIDQRQINQLPPQYTGSYTEILKNIEEHFPYIDKEESRSAFDYGAGHLMLQLPQEALTYAQRDWLHLSIPYHLYIATFTVTSGGWDTEEPNEATLAVIEDLLDIQMAEHEENVFILSSGITEAMPLVTNLINPLSEKDRLPFDSYPDNYTLVQFDRVGVDTNYIRLTREMMDRLCAVHLRRLIDLKRKDLGKEE